MLRQTYLMQQQQQQQGPQQPPQGEIDMTGAGNANIGVGGVPVPGEPQFSGNPPQTPQQQQMPEPPPNAGLPPGLLQ